ncbi:MAG: M20 family peptidase [Clostridia bacterium]|nr:M20 family peptidase [Clostridia bacterium]
MWILWTILGLLGVFLVVTLVRAAFWTPEKTEFEPLPDEQVDVDKYRKDLSDAIKIKTISNVDVDKVDWNEFKRLHALFEERFPLVYKNLKCEEISLASLLFTWEGKNPDLEPIALLGHQDVVPVAEGTEGDWTHPAFDGVDDGEFVWGRGALDMKNHLIAVLESVESLLAEGFEPERTVYLCFGHDEEIVAAPTSGAGSIAAVLKERGVHLDSVIDEGGAILNLNVGKILNKKLAGVGIAEKGYVDYRVSVSAKGGHSSQPPEHTALGALADVIKDIEGHQFKAKMPAFVYELFTKIGKNVSYPARIVTCNLWLLKPLITAVMQKIPPAASLIHTTTAVTMAEGSPAANVLPQKASVTVNFRMMPGVTIKNVEEHIRSCVRNKDIEVEYLKGKEASKVSPTDSRSFKILEEICTRTDPDLLVAPYLVMGGTDAYHYEEVCDNIYRFAPFVMDTKLLLTTHGTDERIPISCMADGLKFFKRYIRMMSAE